MKINIYNSMKSKVYPHKLRAAYVLVLLMRLCTDSPQPPKASRSCQ